MLQQLFEQYIRKNDWLHPNKKFLLAVSGGVDSMVLADLFLKSSISFSVAHCNFQLRGDEANGDEQLVKGWCQANNISYFIQRFDTKKTAEEWQKGIQETARKLRYDWFEQLCKAQGFHYIVTAHHADDNIETFFINLSKGTGINGLKGIPAENGRIIRPLLFAQKQAIVDYAQTHHVLYREDASNTENKYLRNGIRNEVLPLLKKHIPQAIEKIQETIENLAEVKTIYDEAIKKQRQKLIEQRGKDQYISILKLKQTKPLKTYCYELFKPFGFHRSQTEQIIALADTESGKWLASDTHRIIKDRNFLIVTSQYEQENDFYIIDEIPCKVNVAFGSFHFSTITSKKDFQKTEYHIAYIDYSKISMPLILRQWKQGDYFYPLGMGMKKKKLSRFFIDQKIPLHEKEKIWVLESNKKIIWVAGYRLDERFKINDSTTQILKVEMRLH